MPPGGKTIQIFLPDGNPRSIRIAEITSRIVQAVLIPRSKLEDATQRDELSNVGVPVRSYSMRKGSAIQVLSCRQEASDVI